MFLLLVLLLAAGELAEGQAQRMTFFITSVGKGDGANLGGLNGADAHCGQLAADAGANSTGLIWRAYLSANGQRGTAVNARDRIGAGPWFNFRGVQVASDLTNLHTLNGTMNNLGKNNSLTERGGVVNGKGDSPNQHDILTGSTADGVLIGNATCNDWTSNAAVGVVARLGHFDKDGGGEAPTSWNSAHLSRGCSQNALVGTGGAGYFYCFALPGTPTVTFTARTTTTRRTFNFTTTTAPGATTTTTAAPATRSTTTTVTRGSLRTTTSTTTTSGANGRTTTSTTTTTVNGESPTSPTSTTTTTSSAAGGSTAAAGTGATFGSASAGSGSESLPDASNSVIAESAAMVDSSASTIAMASGIVLVALLAL